MFLGPFFALKLAGVTTAKLSASSLNLNLGAKNIRCFQRFFLFFGVPWDDEAETQKVVRPTARSSPCKQNTPQINCGLSWLWPGDPADLVTWELCKISEKKDGRLLFAQLCIHVYTLCLWLKSLFAYVCDLHSSCFPLFDSSFLFMLITIPPKLQLKNRTVPKKHNPEVKNPQVSSTKKPTFIVVFIICLRKASYFPMNLS